MNLSISQILSESWEDFKKLIVNPVILILFLIYSAFSIIPDFMPGEPSVLTLLLIPWGLLLFCIYAYIVKVIYNLKKGETQNIFSEILPNYPRYLWYSLIFMGVLILPTLVIGILGTIIYFVMGKSIWVIVIGVVIYTPMILYISSRLFFYAYLIIVEKDNTPLATSWAMTKNWKILLLFSILTLVIVAVPLLLMFVLNIQETTIDIILLPLNILIGMYTSIAFLNMFLFCRARYKLQTEEYQKN
jgi:hypothetical protein